jgi:hypothetical protein
MKDPPVFHGPVLVPSRSEVACIYDAMYGRTDVHALTLIAKCEAVLNADPKWREPLT